MLYCIAFEEICWVVWGGSEVSEELQETISSNKKPQHFC